MKQTEQYWTEKLDLVSGGHAPVLALNIVALSCGTTSTSMFELQFDLPGWFWWEIAEWILKSSIFMSFHGLLVLTPVWLGQMGRIGLGSPNRSPSSRYYLGSQFLFIPAHQSFLQGTCFLRPTLDQCAMVTHGTACASWRSQNC